MAASAQLRLHVPIDTARDAVATALAEQGFAVHPTPSGSLSVSRGSLGTTLVAGAFAGQDMHVQFDVHLTPTEQGALAEFAHSSVGGFFKGGAIGAAKAADVVREAAHLAGTRLAQQGLLEGTAPDAPAYSSAAAFPAAPLSYPGAAPAPSYPGAAPASLGAPPIGSIPPPVDYAGRTNVVAIVALILGFIFPIGGIIAGSVALAQVKRTGEKGRGLAITGIVAGSVMFVAGIAAIIAFFALVVNAPNEDGSQSVDVFSVQVGDCVNEVATSEVTDIDVIDCALPHDYEVYTEFTVAGGEYPGEEAITTAAEDGCYEAFAGFVGLSYEESVLGYNYLRPTAESWAAGDDKVSCLVYDPSVQVEGTLAGSAR